MSHVSRILSRMTHVSLYSRDMRSCISLLKGLECEGVRVIQACQDLRVLYGPATEGVAQKMGGSGRLGAHGGMPLTRDCIHVYTLV